MAKNNWLTFFKTHHVIILCMLFKSLSKPRLLLTIFAAILLLATIIIDIAIIIDAKETRHFDAVSVTIKPDTSISFSENAKVSDFLEHLDGTIVDDYTINTNSLGEQTVNFEYINIKNRKRPASFTINVVDTVAPQIFGGSAYTVPINYGGDLTDLMLSGDDLDDHPERKIEGTYDLAQIGNYQLQYIITDASGNQTIRPFTLSVVKPTNETSDPYISPKLPITDVIKEYKTSKTKVGIDVSGWQGKIDWEKVKNSGIEFAFLRLGYQTDFDDEYHTDKYFHDNIQAANRLDIPVGIYFYSYASTLTEAEHQANWIKDQIKGYKVELGVAFDWENWHDFNQAGVSFRGINQIANHFLDTLNGNGYSGLLYGSKNYLDLIWQPEKYPVWLAQYYHKPTYNGNFQIWQMSDSGQVPGIDGNVDIDIMYLE